jgi:hypothetical protein
VAKGDVAKLVANIKIDSFKNIMKFLDANVCIIVCPKCFGAKYLVLIYTHCPELMKSMGESW